MQYAETIIVGGGPAGSTCARELVRAGRDVIVLDKAAFPRLKLCAGWITSKAMADLQMSVEEYPHPILKLDVKTHIARLPFALNWFPTPGPNFSIRRVEFDDWLLRRSGAAVIGHEVKQIAREGGEGSEGGEARYVIDDTFTCRNLVGAGGTMCPVRRALFPSGRQKNRQIVTLEKEFSYPSRGDDCHLYFFRRGMAGYAWIVPKGGGFVNIGIGGKANWFKARGQNIHDHFRAFLGDLVAEKRLDRETADNLAETGHPYYLFAHSGEVRRGNARLIGDSAGLASVDLGEGIGPAVESGIMAAREILGAGAYDKTAIEIYSFGGVVRALLERMNAKHVRAAQAEKDKEKEAAAAPA